jgi:hypothetical protein
MRANYHFYLLDPKKFRRERAGKRNKIRERGPAYTPRRALASVWDLVAAKMKAARAKEIKEKGYGF